MPLDLTNLESLLAAAVEIADEAQREAFMDSACAGHADLRAELQSMVRDYFAAASLIDRPAVLQGTIDLTAPSDSGRLIGPYKLLEQIGEGGMGVVYMAEQQRPVRRLVALKIIKPGMDSRQVIARFEAERQALAMMDHPHIARMLDAGMIGEAEGARGQGPGLRARQDENIGGEAPSSLTPAPWSLAPTAGRPYFVMELVRGIPINEFCDQKRLTVRQRLELLVQVCQAVQHAHQKGIIHRDLKPTNVLVTMNDTVAVPKVIDFGIAKALGQQLTDHTLHTGFAQLVGTPLYMSPEQAEMNQFGVDTRSDVYSLGVLLYELLTGTTPFDKETLTKAGLDEMRRIIREQEPPRPSARVSTLQAQALSTVSDRRSIDPRRITTSLRGELDWIVMKALEKERAERYESASGLARDIERYLHDEPVQACPPSATYRFRKFARKNRATIVTVLLVAASLLVGTSVSAWQAIRATAAEAQATANEAQAKKAAAAEAKQRKRAEVNEQKALAAAAAERAATQSETAHRKQAEKNFAAALEAVDRMLEHVSDSELNDVPRVGPLRRKMLADAIAFYDRLPMQVGVAPEVRFQVAETWDRIASLSWNLNDAARARGAFKTSIATLAPLAAEQPMQNKYQATLARLYSAADYLYGDDYEEREKFNRRAIELYAELATREPNEKRWLTRQAERLNSMASSLRRRGKNDEASGCLARALNLLDLSQETDGFSRPDTLFEMAWLSSTVAESDDLFRRAVTLYRSHLSKENKTSHYRNQFAGALWVIAGQFAGRHPEEAEKLWDESIVLWREICGPSANHRDTSYYLVRSLLDQARHQRRLAGTRQTTETPEQVAGRVARAESLFQEAIGRQREMVSKFVLQEDRFALVRILQEQSEYVLDPAAAAVGIQLEDAAARKLQADALLTEAIQLCRQLAAEFSDDAQYRDRLAALLRLQVQHFGQQDGTGRN